MHTLEFASKLPVWIELVCADYDAECLPRDEALFLRQCLLPFQTATPGSMNWGMEGREYTIFIICETNLYHPLSEL